MPSYGHNSRIVRWINKQAPGSVFTITDVQDALANDGGAALSREQVSTSISRLVKYGIGVERKAQGLYVWTPTGVKPKARGHRQGPRRGPDSGVSPLSIASGSSEAVTVETAPPPAPVPQVPEARTSAAPAFSSTFTYDGLTQDEARHAGRFSPGDPVLLNVLAPLDDGGFIGQGDADGRVYSVKPVA